MPSILMFKLFGGVAVMAILASLYLYVHHKGYEEGKAEIQLIVDDLEMKINMADEQARLTKSNQEKINRDLSIESDKRVANIKSYYSRVLRATNKTSTSTTTSDDEGDETASTESTITGCDQAFEQRCALDANHVNTWLEWADKHQIPIQ